MSNKVADTLSLQAYPKKLEAKTIRKDYHAEYWVGPINSVRLAASSKGKELSVRYE